MKKKKWIFCVGLASFIGLVGCGKKMETNITETFSSIEMIEENDKKEVKILEENQKKLEDLNFLVENLEQKHKNLYANISKEEFEAERQKIIDKFSEPMTESEFYYELTHLVALVGDSHTSVAFSDSRYQHLKALGFAIKKYDDDWYLMMLEEQNQKYLGYQLVAIQDVEIEEVYQRAKSICSYENEAWMENQFSNTINFWDTLKYLEIVKEEDEEVTLFVRKDRDSEIENFSIKPMTYEEIMSANILTKYPEKTPQIIVQGLYSAKELTQEAYYIQYNQCQEAEDLPMKDFTEYVEEQIQNKGYQKVIIDLRYNSGGNSNIFEVMIEKISELQKEQQFEVYVLIGSNTFSSAVINACQLKQEIEAVLVGSPTGGNVNAYGEIEYFQLPNLPVTVWYSTKYFELIVGYEKDSLYPDIIVSTTFEDYINGIDREIQTILELE